MNLWPLLAGIAIGLIIIMSIPLLFLLLFLWRFLQKFTRGYMAYTSMIDELRKRGERVNATVTDVRAIDPRLPRPVYTLSARWHNPKTGQAYTFDTRIQDPDKFPIGSSVVILIDPNNPNFHFPEFLVEQKL